MLGWCLNILYFLAVVLGSPLWLARLIRHGKYRRDWGQRFGRIPIRYGLQPVIWVHGVSLGEVSAARTLVSQIHSVLPDFRVVVSSTTDTGLTAAQRTFAPEHVVFRWPLDFTFSVAAALDRQKPSLVILMEGDVWPNFVGACRRRDIPVVVVNGRMGPQKGYPRYRLVRPLAARLFNGLTAIGVQHESYAELFRKLGVLPEKLHVTGMLKYDTADLADHVAGQEGLAAAIGLKPGDRLVVAGGTGDGEERLVLEAFAQAKARLGPAGENVRLAIVPRLPQRFEVVAQEMAHAGLPLARRSQCPDGAAGGSARPGDAAAAPIILGDTMGELRKFYSLATAIFVGRSLVPMGGSDMIEAAALGKPVCFGPHAFNFPQARLMVEAGCVREVADVAALARALESWLREPAGAADLGRAGRDFVRKEQGATRRNIEMICRVLHRVPPIAEGGIATDAIVETGG